MTGVRRFSAALALFLHAWATCADAQIVPDGCWVGHLGEAGETRRVALELWKNADATWGVRMHRLTSKIGTDSMAATFAEGALAFSNEQIACTATFSADGSSLTGELARQGKKLPVVLGRVVEADAAGRALVGNWAGALEHEGIPRLPLVIKISPAPCGQVLVTMDSPEQGASDLPITELRATPDSLHFGMSYVSGRYDGAVNPERTQITGKWSQAGLVFELDLTRSDSLPVQRRPQEPQKPLPYREEEVTYENPQQNVTIAGTLTLPEGAGPFPAVLLISGSGAQNRDEALMGHKPFLVLADHLTRRGIAVLRVDDRGIGGSTGDLFAADLDDNASDARAGVEFLRRRQEIAPGKIGLIGHSEGALVAPLVATRGDAIAFLVHLAGPGVPLEDLLQAQSAAIARASGASERLIEKSAAVSKRFYEILAHEAVDSTAQRRIASEVERATAELAAVQSTPADTAIVRMWASQSKSQVQVFTTRWFRHLVQHDPAPALKKVRVPVLALFGSKDLQVPPEQNAPAVEKALRAGKNKDFTVDVLPGLNHLFQHAETGLVDEYGRIEETMAPEVLERIAAWVVARTR